MTEDLEPFDPTSTRGAAITDELSAICAEIRIAIAQRKKAAERSTAANDDAA